MADPIFIEVITSPNCVHSPTALKVARQLIRGSREMIVLREVSLASKEGVERAKAVALDATPAIMINGALRYIGVPSLGAMQRMLSETVEKEKERNSYFF